MITFNFDNTNGYIDNNLLGRKEEVFTKLKFSSMTGWNRPVDKNIIDKIYQVRDKITANSKCLVVIGIGGSFLGSYALNNMFKDYFKSSFEVIYAGTTLSSKYMDNLLNYLSDKDFSLNVISKSGTTMEVMITYKLLKDFMKKKYNDEELKERIIITTDEVNGKLREEVNVCGYESFIIPSDIGGRYSLMTPAHLLPMSFNIDLDKLIDGYNEGLNLNNEAFEYATRRISLLNHGKVVENYSCYEENFSYYIEWLKQLFGETEGKNKTGIFPVGTIGTRDLHSLGQFIQEGNPIIFETFIKILNSNLITYKDKNLNDINNIVIDSVVKAHVSGGVPCNIITIDKVSEENIGKLSSFFMLSAAYSGFLLGVDPFNQPGVEVYKKEVHNNLDNILGE